MNLYLVVRHRGAPEQTFANTWGQQGRLVSITTTDAVIAAAQAAKQACTKVFIYEISCPNKLKSHISQEVSIDAIDEATRKITFSDQNLLFRAAPFRARQGMTYNLDERLPSDLPP